MAKLTIPKASRSALLRLIQLSNEHFAEFVDALSQASPDLYQGNLVAFVQERVSFDPDTVYPIVRMLLELYAARLLNLVDVHIFTKDIIESLRSANQEAEQLDIDWLQAETRLNKVMGYDQVAITAKALSVMSDHAYVYCNRNARILTDIRPIFSNDLDLQPSAAVIVHTLKLAYHEGEDTREIYIALDPRDLHELRKLIERADKKADALRHIIDTANMQYLDPEVHEHGS